jgi:hypothetical protein
LQVEDSMDEAAPQAAGEPLGQMSEEELLRRAAMAMDRATAAGPGTLGWSVQWAVYDAYMAEMDLRVLRWASTAHPAALREMHGILKARGLNRNAKLHVPGRPRRAAPSGQGARP